MARAPLSADALVDVALRLVDEEGPAAATLAAVASRADVATPSLYKHVRNLAELRALMSVRIMDELAERIGGAVLGRSADEAVRALMLAWREYAVAHPHRYSALVQTPEPVVARAGERLVAIMLAALRAYGAEDSPTVHAVRCLRAAVHGFALLEAANAFQLPEDLDDTYELLVHMVVSGLRTPLPRT
ncbi:TetR-like C-terminal domain-containing protein [Saccharothrix longispora]|uniref:TetR/AcrR family transcriptional regulator n=1 Tax=Saccharothrix longispora TaxID=33920 RepID=UPI0028FD7D03|nr:TetR-like C-terminal domain-containing protein [Saccharothrix longispora]MBY8848820.1 WHG domain-containing protein [Saccharothrix sp. MB29]MDU0290521.1 TetR-like C-terminal domain-containing protein [Saccharothrix longispora]